jgi:hypothetical protein
LPGGSRGLGDVYKRQEVHGARTALRQATAKFGVVQFQIVAQRVQQGHLRIAVNLDGFTVNQKGGQSHVVSCECDLNFGQHVV